MRHALIGAGTCALVCLLGCAGGDKEPATAAAQPARAPAPAATAAAARQRSNVELIAAMPEGAQGVMVERLTAFENTNFAPFADPAAWESAMSEEELGADAGDLWPTACRAALRAGVVVRASGGSDFKAPDDIGVGDVRTRMILVTRGDLSALRADLDEGESVVGLKREPGEPVVYSASSVVMGDDHSDVFVALPDDHTLVMGQSAEEARSMCEALVRSAAEARLPERWAGVAATMKLDSPIVVLRVYDRALDGDWSNPGSRRLEGGRAVVTAFGAALESPSRFTLKLTALSPEPAKAAAAYEQIAGPLVKVVCEEGRFTAEYRRTGIGAPGEVYFIAMHLYGLNIAL